MPIGFFAIVLCKKLRLLDIPGSAKHKLHSVPVPIAGGITLMAASTILLLIFRHSLSNSIISIFLPALIIFGFGLADDIKGLSAPYKLFGQILAAVVLIYSGVYIQIFHNFIAIDITSSWAFIPQIMDWTLTIFWIVGIVNAFNLIDSMDGLVSGISAWAFGFFVIATIESGQTDLSFFAAVFLGINLVLSFYNSSPAKMFLGDSGAQTLGFLLAAISIIYVPIYRIQESSWFVPIMLLAIPIFDTCLVFFSRLRRRIPFYKANRDHTYHRLINIGVDSHRAVFMMHMAALIFQCLAMIAVSLEPFFANIIFGICLLLGLVAIIILERPRFLMSSQ
ncbi:MAG: undecaprenyl/decaprenyl-phosphate alpha-N-acetylglucosaminyl 1-phosphate transferase [Anaerolineaceae bacterium]|nr:undecaprenyl/decaprenyl-phosphate alpha-N-acetylglucosaminyl 1-phosphate transferase [Anaerolineaceae bacterium]